MILNLSGNKIATVAVLSVPNSVSAGDTSFGFCKYKIDMIFQNSVRYINTPLFLEALRS